MIDFCCGTKAASAAMFDRGWKVVTLDIDEKFMPDIVCDIRNYTYSGPTPDLMWFSPPCTDFSFNSLPWNANKQRAADISIYGACKRIIRQSKPKYWIIENVRGAMTYFGPPTQKRGPFYLWGYYPPIGKGHLNYKTKGSHPGRNSHLRAAIPYELSLAIALSIENNPDY